MKRKKEETAKEEKKERKKEHGSKWLTSQHGQRTMGVETNPLGVRRKRRKKEKRKEKKKLVWALTH
jgi:hypothetical protein